MTNKGSFHYCSDLSELTFRGWWQNDQSGFRNMSNHLSAIWLAHFARVQYAHAGVWDKPRFKPWLQTKRKVTGQRGVECSGHLPSNLCVCVFICSFTCPSLHVFVKKVKEGKTWNSPCKYMFSFLYYFVAFSEIVLLLQRKMFFFFFTSTFLTC